MFMKIDNLSFACSDLQIAVFNESSLVRGFRNVLFAFVKFRYFKCRIFRICRAHKLKTFSKISNCKNCIDPFQKTTLAKSLISLRYASLNLPQYMQRIKEQKSLVLSSHSAFLNVHIGSPQ